MSPVVARGRLGLSQRVVSPQRLEGLDGQDHQGGPVHLLRLHPLAAPVKRDVTNRTGWGYASPRAVPSRVCYVPFSGELCSEPCGSQVLFIHVGTALRLCVVLSTTAPAPSPAPPVSTT